MALQKSVLNVPFTGGLAERTASRLVAPGQFLRLENVSFDRDGRLSTRRGFEALSSLMFGGSAELGTLKTIFAAPSCLHAIASDTVYTSGKGVYAYSSDHDRWARTCEFPDGETSSSSVLSASTTMFQPTMVRTNGYRVYAWGETGALTSATVNIWTINVAIVADETGALVGEAEIESSSSYSCPKLVTDRVGKVALLYTDGANKYARVMDTAVVPSFGARTTLRSDGEFLVTGGPFGVGEITGIGTNGGFVLFYEDNTRAFKLFSYDFSLAQVATATVTPASRSITDHARAFAVCENAAATSLFVAWTVMETGGANNSVAYVAWQNPTTLANVTAGTIAYNAGASGLFLSAVGLAPDPNGNAALIVNSPSLATGASTTEDAAFLGYAVQIGPTSVSGIHTATERVEFVSDPFWVTGEGDPRAFAWCICTLQRQTTYFLAELFGDLTISNASIHSLWHPRIPSFARGASSLARVVEVGDAEHETCGIVPTAMTQVSASTVLLGRHAIYRFTSDFTYGKGFSAFVSNGANMIRSGVLCSYDGSRAVENGFFYYPPQPSVTFSAGGALQAKAYAWCIVYAWQDMVGNVHRSAPSLPVTGTPALNQKADLVLHTLSYSWKDRNLSGSSTARPVWIEVYRTEGDGSIFYRQSDDPSPIALYNDHTVRSITYSDTKSDANINTNATLYTTGGILPNFNVPTPSTVVEHNGRLFSASGSEVFYSKTIVQGEAPAFTDVFRFSMPAAVTAFARLDTNLAIFTEDHIYVLPGNGPDDAGAGQAFPLPQIVSSDVGCIDDRSLVLFPGGLLFLSHKGFYVLDRSLAVQPSIGDAIIESLAQYPTCMGAALLQDEQEVRFSMGNGTSVGRTLVYDYTRNKWCVHTYWDADTETASVVPQSACVHDGAYHWATPGGAFYRESDTEYTDAGHWVTATWESANIALGGLQGYQRCWHVAVTGERFTSHGLQIEIATNFSSSFESPKVYPDGAIDAMGEVENVRVYVHNQKCTALRVRVTTLEPTVGAVGTGQACAFDGLAFEIGQKPGLRKDYTLHQQR